MVNQLEMILEFLPEILSDGYFHYLFLLSERDNIAYSVTFIDKTEFSALRRS